MTNVHIEHAVKDFAAWKGVFGSFAQARADHNVRHYDISQPVDDSNFVMIRLDFDNQSDAEGFIGFMRGIWGSDKAADVLGSTPQVRITETVEANDV